MRNRIPNIQTLRGWMVSSDAPVFVQFVKYGFCGVLALLTYVGTTSLLVVLFPEWVARSLPDNVRALHLNVFQGIAFIPSNVVAYLLNRKFVFTPGRHKAHHEAFWFLVVALISMGAGTLATYFLIRFWSAPNWTGVAASTITAALMNFVCRKFFVFAR